MKEFDYSNWILTGKSYNLLMFAQSLQEQLVYSGHDSLKVQALNFHSLCKELITTIRKIDDGIVDKANIKPLYEELGDSFENDPVVKSLYGSDFKRFFYLKNSDGEYNRCTPEITKDCTSNESRKIIKRVVQYWIEDMDYQSKYFEKLKNAIQDAIQVCCYSYENASDIYRLSRALLTELVYRNYCQEYIYLLVNSHFFSGAQQITDDNVMQILTNFWGKLDFKRKKYNVILPLNTKSLFEKLRSLENVRTSENSRQLFHGSCPWIIECVGEAQDPEQARRDVVKTINMFLSTLQYHNHQGCSYNSKEAIVEEVETASSYSLKSPVNPLKRGELRSRDEAFQRTEAMVRSIFNKNFVIIINAIALHSSAFNSNEVSNQLLNLWTIIEILIENETLGLCKINQISNVITTVLNLCYIKSLLTQLNTDLHRCIKSEIDTIISTIDDGANSIEKLAAVLILPKYESIRNDLYDKLNPFPLIKYRIEHYTQVFSNRKNLKCFLVAHRKRISWHVMRIYRNRNMIVHDGTHFTYIDLLIRSLHYYVDSLIDTICVYAEKGFVSIPSIYTELKQREMVHTILLDEKNPDQSPKPITDEYIDMLFLRV